MCLLEVGMCGKCRSNHFQLEGGVRSLKTGRGFKNFQTGGSTFAGGVSNSLHAMLGVGFEILEKSLLGGWGVEIFIWSGGIILLGEGGNFLGGGGCT